MTHNKAPWPRYASHSEASCFNCGGDFGDGFWFHAETIAPGNGQYVQSCERCHMDTYYDLTNAKGTLS